MTGATGPHGRAVAQALTAAMAGAHAVYAVATPFAGGPEIETKQGEQLVAAARETGMPWLILASVASADQQTGVPHFDSKWRIEEDVRASGIPHTIVAPTYSFENLDDLAEVVAAGELALALSPSRPLQQVALADLGAVIAALLARRHAFLGERIEIAGDQPTPREMADALSDAGGRPVAYRPIALEDVSARRPDIAAMHRFLEQTGYDVDIPALPRRLPELRWTTFTAWVGTNVTPVHSGTADP